MKSPQQWKKILETVNFPNFSKSDNEEMIEFIFSNCKQRDALLTWIVIQLGADFGCRVLKHEVIVEYLKKRRIAGNDVITNFVEATLPRYDQEVIWDKIFSFLKMQKRLIPQPYEGIPRSEPLPFDNTDYNDIAHGFTGNNYLEPLYKELEVLKKLRRIKPSDIEYEQGFGDQKYETTDDYPENREEDKDNESMAGDMNNDRAADPRNIHNSEKTDQKGVKPLGMPKKLLPTEKTTSGTWYCTPDGMQKVFVPIGAPPLGEFNFDSKTMKIVWEEEQPSDERKLKFAEQMEALEKSFKNLMKENVESK